MNGLPALQLAEPLSRAWLHGLLFAGFLFHMLFVLLLLGTAFIAVYYSLKEGRTPSAADASWSRRVLRTFAAHKSIAVVLGVAPLLLIQLGHAIPFFNAASLLAPRWLLILALLMPVSIIFDSLGHHAPVRRGLHLTLSILALILLLGIPANFVAVLVTAEQSASWLDILRAGYRLTGPLGLHALVRFLHVLAAAVIFGALFHYIFTTRGDPAKRAGMLSWLVSGIMAQAVIGPMLTLTLVPRPDQTSILLLLVGLLALVGFIKILANAGGGVRDLNLRLALPFLFLIALFMLLVRQHQQDRAFAPLEAKADEAARGYAALLEPYRDAAVTRYKRDLETVYDNGPTIYGRSCAFCHGEKGDGRGAEAAHLSVPPENITALRVARPYLRGILAAGIEGSAMPYFAVFTRPKLELLIDSLNERWRVLELPPEVEGVTADGLARADQVYEQTCAGCHGRDGVPAANALKFKPPPPDLSRYSLLPERAIEVLNEGYRGTVMGPFGRSLEPAVKTALVRVLYHLRRPARP